MAILSILTLILAVVVGTITKINIGLLAIALTSVLGLFKEGLGIQELVSDFPSSLFLTLLGVTLLFGHAQHNRTLDIITFKVTRMLRGNAFWIPIGFFVLTSLLSSVGAGNIGAAGLIAPAAMTTAKKFRIPLFLMSIMVANGANSGALSPIAPTGIIAAERMAKIGLTGLTGKIYLNNFLAHLVVAFAGYLLFGGYRLLISSKKPVSNVSATPEEIQVLQYRHWFTLSIIGIMLFGVVIFHLDLILAAFVGYILLNIFSPNEERKDFSKVPWGVILMVCGVSMLATFMDKVGGLNLLITFVTKYSTEWTVTAIIGFAAALVSVYSSSSGVVLPTFILLIPKLTEKITGISAAGIASSICISAHLVDASPLSTIGALCLASVSDDKDQRLLFRQMLAWGLSMTIVAAIISFLFFH